MNPLALFGLVLKSSLFSTGGLGNVASLHHDLLAQGAAGEREFAEALAIGQVSPGPNGLWVVSLGYLVGGWAGAGASLVAICLPPLLVLVVDRLYRRFAHHPVVEGFLHGLSLALVGVFAVVLAGLLRAGGLTLPHLVICAASVALGATRRVPIVVIIGLAAVAGWLLR